MKKLLNTLYVTTQGAYLAKEGETVLIRVEQENRLRVPIHTLGGIVCFGQVSCSPPLMGFCAENSVGLSFLSEHGKISGTCAGPCEWLPADVWRVRSRPVRARGLKQRSGGESAAKLVGILWDRQMSRIVTKGLTLSPSVRAACANYFIC